MRARAIFRDLLPLTVLRRLHVVRGPRFGQGVFCVGLVLALSALAVRDPRTSKGATARTVDPIKRHGAVSPGNRPARPPQVLETYGKLPLAFEANRGQTDRQVKFLARGSGYTVFLTQLEAVLTLSDDGSRRAASSGTGAEKSAVVRMQLVGATAAAEPTGEQTLPGASNYFIGNDPTRWRTHVPTYARVRYHDAYPGVDLVYYGHQGQLEYDFVVAPGASPAPIRLAVTGPEFNASLHLDADGNLIVGVNQGLLCFHKPVVYQPAGAAGAPVEGRYVLKGAHEVGFEIGPTDPTKPVVIDPTLTYSTYFGGSRGDWGSGIALDSVGNAYVIGSTTSTDFPTANPVQPTNHGNYDAFVAALDPTGATLLYSTYLGGSSEDHGQGIAVDGAGNAYVTGYTISTDFPTANPLQPTNNGSLDAFVAALDPTGATLLYSTYLGGSGSDSGLGIAVDSAGNAYITGSTWSTNFPVANPLQPANHGFSDAFIAALDPTGATLLYSTYLGGNNTDVGTSIALDSAGNAYVTGYTWSPDFPTANPLQPTNNGLVDAFVTAVDPTGVTLLYSTYLGGSKSDVGEGIAVDSAGNAYVTGYTESNNFPVANPLQPTNGGADNAFVAALDPTGATLLYSTYLGGSSHDYGYSIAVDSAGNAYITGSTESTNFPVANPLQPANHGFNDAFIAALDPIGATLLYSTYLGGSGYDMASGIAVDSAGNAYLAGQTTSTNFPTANPLQPANHGTENAFVAKIAP